MSYTLIGAVFIVSMYMVQSTNIYFKNSCSSKITIYETSHGVTAQSIMTLNSGRTSSAYEIPSGFSGRFTTTDDPEATLFECSLDSDSTTYRKFWYNLSVIPPGSWQCYSWEACVEQTQSNGYNVAMSVQPSDTSGNNCESLTCLADGCSDAYGYPTDDWKVKVCDPDVDITLTICPSSSFTYDDESGSSSLSSSIIAVICILSLLCIVVGIGGYCFIKRRKQKASVSFEENKEENKDENDTKLEEDGDKAGYDMDPIDTTQV